MTLAAGTLSGISPTMLAGAGAVWLVALLGLALLPRATPDLPVLRTRQDRPGRRRVTGLARPVVAAVLVAALALALIQVLSAASRSRGSQDPTAGTGTGASPGESAPAGRSALDYVIGPLDLRHRGRLPDTPLYRVPLDSPALWRAGYLDRYLGQQWGSSQAAGSQPLGSAEVTVPAGPDDPAAAGAATRTDLVAPQQVPAAVVIAPGVPAAVRLTGRGSLVSEPGRGLLLIGLPPGAGPAPFRVSSVRRPVVGDPTTDPLLQAARGADPDDPRWLQLPDSVPDRVTNLSGALVPAGTNRLAAVRAVESYLRANARYTLNSPVPAPGVDAVDDFLFVSRQGFCEQFAAAEVVLLRAAGIPARLAIGFAGGVDPQDGTRLLRAREGHAWAEVWFPGQGWVSSDPTAGSTPSDDPTGTLADWLRRHRLLLILAAMWLLAATGLLAVLLRRRRRHRLPPDSVRDPLLPEESRLLLDAFDRLETALERTGRARRPPESLADLTDRLAGHPALRSALAVYERIAFAARTPDAAQCRQAADDLDRVSARLLAEVGDR